MSPVVTDTTIGGFAHCPDSRCPGNEPVPVELVRQVTEFSYLDGGGDMPGVEKSVEHYRVADETDAKCGCGRDRDLSAIPRPEYSPLSGFPQDGLLDSKRFDPTRNQAGGNDAVVAELMRELRDLREQIGASAVSPDATFDNLNAPTRVVSDEQVVAEVVKAQKPERTPEEQAQINERMAKMRAARKPKD